MTFFTQEKGTLLPEKGTWKNLWGLPASGSYAPGSYLVRAKVPPLVREKGCKKCNKPRCLTCQNIHETDIFRCTADGKQYKVIK
jgi:hypothetical protein